MAAVPAFTKKQLEELDKLTDVNERIKWFYINGTRSIQDIARTHRMSVEEVLEILDMPDVVAVETQGELIDQAEAGNKVVVNPRGNTASGNFSTN